MKKKSKIITTWVLTVAVLGHSPLVWESPFHRLDVIAKHGPIQPHDQENDYHPRELRVLQIAPSTSSANPGPELDHRGTPVVNLVTQWHGSTGSSE